MGAAYTHTYTECMGYARLAEAEALYFTAYLLVVHCQSTRGNVASFYFHSLFFTAHLCVVHCPHTNLCIALSSVATSFLFSVSLDSLSGQKNPTTTTATTTGRLVYKYFVANLLLLLGASWSEEKRRL